MEQHIIEGNKLIAEFMDDCFEIEGRVSFTYSSDEEFPLSNKPFSYDRIIDEVGGELDEFGSMVTVKVFSYHNSWDWLMPVVSKLIVNCEGPEDLSHLKYAVITDDIDQAWNDVVDYIKTNKL